LLSGISPNLIGEAIVAPASALLTFTMVASAPKERFSGFLDAD
jgi:hypothetical protein